MFKRCKVVMLPTNQKAPFKVGTLGLILNPRSNKPECFKVARITDFEYCWSNERSGIIDGIGVPQHLYILSDDEIKEGDWCYLQWGIDVNGNPLYTVARCSKIGGLGIHYFNGISQCYRKDELKVSKIIATTNMDLELPSPSQSFIKKYCEKGEIDEVMVKYHYIESLGVSEGLFLTVSPDNTITIKKVKDSWTREEVESIAWKAYIENIDRLKEKSIDEFEKWFDRNINFLNYEM